MSPTEPVPKRPSVPDPRHFVADVSMSPTEPVPQRPRPLHAPQPPHASQPPRRPQPHREPQSHREPRHSPPSMARPRPGVRRSAAGRLRTGLHRHRWLRWAAASGAALAVFAALSGRSPDPPPAAPVVIPPGPADLLPLHTRGVPVPVEGQAFAPGDLVDVHAVLDGSAVVRQALIVKVDDEGEEAVVAVPAEQVDATVDALTTGGVILVLVPRPPSSP